MRTIFRFLTITQFLWAESAVAFPTDEQLQQMHNRNARGEVAETWKAFADAGDIYAKSAYKIFADPVSLPHCAIQAHWDNVVGPVVRESVFMTYAKNYQKRYLNFVLEQKRYPNSYEIEELYAHTLDDMNLPRILAIDLVINEVPKHTARKKVSDLASSVIGFGGRKQGKEWFDFVKLPPDRISSAKLTANIGPEKADELIWKDNILATSCLIKNCISRPKPRQAPNGTECSIDP